MFTPEQLKDLALFNSWKAMQFEVAHAQLAATAQQLAQQLEAAGKELEAARLNAPAAASNDTPVES